MEWITTFVPEGFLKYGSLFLSDRIVRFGARNERAGFEIMLGDMARFTCPEDT
ncbi:MAG: hypothetical protein ACP5VS_05580 [Desulfomonilaceae bacterium]